jgi:hypothetical protein
MSLPANMRLALPGSRSPPIASRIVELPEEENAAVACDARSGLVAYCRRAGSPRGRLWRTTGEPQSGFN